jgi:hypothetical protein
VLEREVKMRRAWNEWKEGGKPTREVGTTLWKEDLNVMLGQVKSTYYSKALHSGSWALCMTPSRGPWNSSHSVFVESTNNMENKIISECSINMLIWAENYLNFTSSLV